jgi:spore maturation protein CgeB
VVVPLRIARGVQNKVLEAMAAARVVLCSPQAAAGIEAVAGQHLLVAETPEQWVDQLEQLLTNSEDRRRIATAARSHIQQHYNWDARLDPMIELISNSDVRCHAG